MLKAKATSGPRAFIPGEHCPVPTVGFDYAALDGPASDDAGGERLKEMLQAICEWLYPPHCRPSTILLRAYAFVWFIRPHWLGNPTQVELARRLKISKQSLGKVINQMRKRFGFYIAGMRSDAARAKFAANARTNAQALAAARKKRNLLAKSRKLLPA